MSERLLLWIFKGDVIKTNELVMSDHVVFLPCYHTIFVGVKLREALLCIVQSVFSVDVLNP